MAEKTNIIQCFTHFWQALLVLTHYAIGTCTRLAGATFVRVIGRLNAIIALIGDLYIDCRNLYLRLAPL
jgi:hypothetical protein